MTEQSKLTQVIGFSEDELMIMDEFLSVVIDDIEPIYPSRGYFMNLKTKVTENLVELRKHKKKLEDRFFETEQMTHPEIVKAIEAAVSGGPEIDLGLESKIGKSCSLWPMAYDNESGWNGKHNKNYIFMGEKDGRYCVKFVFSDAPFRLAYFPVNSVLLIFEEEDL